MLWTALLAGCASDLVKSGPTTAAAPAPIVGPRVDAATADVARPAPRRAAPDPAAAVDAEVDTWTRVQSRLRFSAAENGEVRRELQWYREHPRYLLGMSERARPYLHFITEELEDRDLPGELALLPILESGFRADAASPYGAAGLWQFMGGTGNRFGLEINRWYDGRMDVTRSTEAALSYLQALHDRFDDDWLVAIAAYNAGWGNIEKVIVRQRRLGRPTDFWSLPLSRETRSLVARMVALSIIFRAPERHGIALEPLPDAPWFVPVELDEPTDLRRFGEALGVSRAEFAALNAAYPRQHTGPKGGTVLVPARLGDRARELADAGAGRVAPPAATSVAAVTPRNGGEVATHRARAGESLWTIAKRHDVSTARLAAANGLTARSTLRVGQRLRLPGVTRRDGSSAAVRPVRYRVRAGDSLWTIARQFKVSIPDLLAWNGITRARPLQPGQELVVSRPG